MLANAESREGLLPGPQPARPSLCLSVAERRRFPVWCLVREQVRLTGALALWPDRPHRPRLRAPSRGGVPEWVGGAEPVPATRSLPLLAPPTLARPRPPPQSAPGTPAQIRLSLLASRFLSCKAAERLLVCCSSSPNEKSMHSQSWKTFYDLILLSVCPRSCALIPNVLFLPQCFNLIL